MLAEFSMRNTQNKMIQLLYMVAITMGLLLFVMKFIDIIRIADAAQGVGRRASLYNIELTTATSEYSKELDINDRPITQLQVKCRTNNDIYIGFTEGSTSDSYITLPGNGVYFENMLNYKGTIYIKGSTDSLTAELLIWD